MERFLAGACEIADRAVTDIKREYNRTTVLYPRLRLIYMLESTSMTARAFFDGKLPIFLARTPNSLRLDAVYLFRIGGPEGGDWMLDLHSPPCVRRPENNPDGDPVRGPACDCVIDMSDHDFELLLADADLSKELFYQKRIQVEGSIMLASQLPNILSIVNAPSPAGGLAELFSPMPPNEFLSKYWPRKALVAHGSSDRFDALATRPELRSIDALLDCWPARVRLSSEFEGSLASAAEARQCYQRGCSLSFDMADRFISGISVWRRKLQWDLCLPANVVARCLVYASSPGTGAGMHFDQNANFVVHLQGKKRWWIAPNTHVVDPLEQYAASSTSVSADMELYARQNLPRSMPADAEVIDLQPGSVLFVPRGWWHATRGEEHSLQLNFTFSQPAWVELLMPVLYRRLIRHAHWRELAHGAGAGCSSARQAAERRLDELIEGLAADLSPLDAAGVISELRPAQALESMA
jgi:50S ribosomal protein L16 3-hydroxylase